MAIQCGLDKCAEDDVKLKKRVLLSNTIVVYAADVLEQSPNNNSGPFRDKYI